MIKIPVYQPSLSGNEKLYVNECLDSSWISSKGKFISKFENKFSEFVGVKHSTAVANGTVALHLALVTLGIGQGDEVIVPTFTYIASVNAITYTGAKPVFVDSYEDTLQVSIEDIQKKITPKTKAVMAVHLYGHPCEMDKLVALCKERKLFLIEDCAESFGSEYKGKQTGTFGDIATFSFFGNKTITTGEGGMVSTNDQTLYERSVHFKGQGLAQHRQYWHDVVGYNYRMTNICAAIGLAQLERATSILKRKRDIAQRYQRLLPSQHLRVLGEVGEVKNSYWMVTILLNNPDLREALSDFLTTVGIETRPTFYPVHTMPMYAAKFEKHPLAEKLGRSGMNIPSYPDLSDHEIEFVCSKIAKFFEDKKL